MKDKYSIVLASGITLYVNPFLIQKRGVSDENLTLILHAHYYKSQLYQEMEEFDSPPDLKEYARKIEEVEYYLQELWGFPKNNAYHKFWEVPHCSCGSLDNKDAYGTGFRHYSSVCPVHS